MTGNNGNACAGNKHADTVAERIHLAGPASSAFGEQNVTTMLGEKTLAKSIYRVMATILPPHRQRVQHAGSESRDGRGFEECITGGERENAVSQPKGQSSRQDHHVEMTGMVGHNDKGRGRWKILSPQDFEVFGESENPPDPPPPEVAGDETNEAAFAFDRAHSVRLTDAKVMSRLIFPIVHRCGRG